MSRQAMTLEQMKTEAAALFGTAAVGQLEARGRDFLEGRRAGCEMWSAEEKRYLDADTNGGIFNLGRRHPELAEAFKGAVAQTDQGNFPMISREKAALAEALSRFVPGSLDCAMFSVVRGETVEGACKIARGVTGRSELIAFDGSWHGETGFAMTLSDRNDKRLYGEMIPDVFHLPFDDLDAAKQAIGKHTAAVILEPLQAENHARAVSAKFAKGLQRLCRKHGALLIVDETQTGLGRCGAAFAYMSLGIEPDMLITGEALGGGLFPIAATLLTQKVNAYLNAHPLIHLSTFGGSDLGCRVALKTLEIMERERIWEKAARQGSRFKLGLGHIAADYPELFVSVAGEGLLLSLKCRDDDTAAAFVKALSTRGLLTSQGRGDRSSVLFRPPLTLDDATADEMLKIAVLAGDDLSNEK